MARMSIIPSSQVQPSVLVDWCRLIGQSSNVLASWASTFGLGCLSAGHLCPLSPSVRLNRQFSSLGAVLSFGVEFDRLEN
ncbi:hypothetical protein [Cohnella herbarum]|uniref:Uncharacterized protein n=1 Tax=Cohnella herbarum TaxID=2728023 RepID=A0A7Z2VII0_9BACL|nr:hypothetical protein [Cohnella herbarum]QJD83664.1 hypothetical protein HH215_11075 [Cohnella herbarum]